MMKKLSRKRLRKDIQELESASMLLQNDQELELEQSVSANEEVLKQVFDNCSDIVFRPILINSQTKILLIYTDGLVDTKTVEQVVLKPMMFEGMPSGLKSVDSIGEIIQNQLIAVSQVKTVSKVREVVEGVLKANIVILTDGENQALVADLKGFEKRSIEEPAAEISVRGPRDGFTETLRLKMEPYSIGELSQTDVVIAYIEDIAPDSVLDEVRQRVQRIQIDGVLESAFIEEFMEY
jgi:spore germination protein KA